VHKSERLDADCHNRLLESVPLWISTHPVDFIQGKFDEARIRNLIRAGRVNEIIRAVAGKKHQVRERLQDSSYDIRDHN